MVERIREEIEAAAPVKAGGSYVLEFTKYNGGRLRIRQTAEADRVRGVFFKDPGATDILVYCPEPAMKYTCVVSAYKAEDGTSKTLLTVDLTEEYQALYPEAGITEGRAPGVHLGKRKIGGRMAKVKKAFFCKNCGFEAPKWLGRCPSCGEWNTFAEEIIARESGSVPAVAAGPCPRRSLSA